MITRKQTVYNLTLLLIDLAKNKLQKFIDCTSKLDSIVKHSNTLCKNVSSIFFKNALLLLHYYYYCKLCCYGTIISCHSDFNIYASKLVSPDPVVLNLFPTMPPFSNCALFQAPLSLNKLEKQMHLLIKLSMLQGAVGFSPPAGECPSVKNWVGPLTNLID